MRRFYPLMLLALLVALVMPREAAAQTDTTNVSFVIEPGAQHCWYRADLVLSAVEDSATYQTKYIPIGDMATTGLTWLADPKSDTLEVDVDVSMDAMTWYSLGLTATDSLVTPTWTTSTNAALLGARWARFSIGWPGGSTQTVSLVAKVPLQSYAAGKPQNCYQRSNN